MQNETKGHCPTCGPDRTAKIVSSFDRQIDDKESGIWLAINYSILQCGGCQSVYYRQEETFSEDLEYRENPATGEDEPYIPIKVSYWPAPSKRKTPEWLSELIKVDHHLHSIAIDIYTALDNDLGVLAAIGMRTCFDRAAELLGIDAAKTFNEKLNELASTGRIGADEREHLDTLTDAGSAAAHRGWRPTFEELGTMMAILEAFLYRTYVLGPQAKKLKPSIPTKQRRKQA